MGELPVTLSFDPVTNLPGQDAFIECVNAVLVEKGRPDGSAAILLLDLDGFRTIKDTYGHCCPVNF